MSSALCSCQDEINFLAEVLCWPLRDAGHNSPASRRMGVKMAFSHLCTLLLLGCSGVWRNPWHNSDSSRILSKFQQPPRLPYRELPCSKSLQHWVMWLTLLFAPSHGSEMPFMPGFVMGFLEGRLYAAVSVPGRSSPSHNWGFWGPFTSLH